MVSNQFPSFLKRLIDFQGRQRFTRKTRRNVRTAGLFRQPANRYCAAELLEDRLLLSASSLTMSPPFRLGNQTVPLSSAQPVASSTAQPASATTGTPTQIEPAVNAPPAVTAPANVVLQENGSYSFAGTISVEDTSASGTSDSVTLSVTDGALSLGSTNGLTFASGSNGSSSMTFSGTLTNLNSALNGLIYTSSTDFSGSDSLQISVDDAGDGLTGSSATSIIVTPVPIVTAPATANLALNGSFTFPAGAISVSDAGADLYHDELILSVSHGALWLPPDYAYLASTSGSSNGTSSIYFSGTLASMNESVNGLLYEPNANYTGSDTLTISLYNPEYRAYGTATVSIAVDTAPAVSAPAYVGVTENTPFTFANTVNLTDPTVSGASDSLSLSVSDGTLTLGSTAGIAFASGANGSSSMAITGTLSDLNAAVSSLIYTPDSSFIGADSLQMSLSNANTGTTGSTTVSISDNGPPTITVPASVFVGVNDPYNFYVNVADSGASGDSDSLTLTTTNGTISIDPTNVTVTSGANNSSSITINGSIDDLNGSVVNLTYTPNSNYVGPDTLKLTQTNALDNLTGSASVSIDDVYTPNVSAQAQMYVLDNNPDLIGSIKLTDLEATNTSDSLTLRLQYGESITLASTTGLTFTAGANGTRDLTVTGSMADLNAAVDGLAATMDESDFGILDMSLSDSLDGLSGGWNAYVDVAGYPPPIIAAPSVVSVPVNGSFTFSGGAISITDPESVAIGGVTDSVPLSVSDGTLTLASTNGLTFTSGSNDSSSMTVSGTLADVNAALNGLVYTPSPGYTGSDSLVMFGDHTYDREWSSAIVTIDVGEQPSVSAPSSQFVAANGSFSFNNSIILSDPEAAGLSDSVSLSVASGTIDLGAATGITILSGANDSSSMMISGTLANLNSALNLQYLPNPNYLGADSLQLSLTDLGDSLTQPASVAITVAAPPAMSAPASASLNENGSYTFSGTISATDATAAGTSDSVSLSVADGTLTLGSSAGISFISGSNGSSAMTIDGTLTNLNAALSGLVYAPDLNYVGPDTLQISVNDSIDQFAGSGRVALTVNAVPPPAVTAPPTASLNENSSYTFSGSAISLADTIASGTSDSVSLSVANGTLTLGSTTGITFSSGRNGSSSMTINGTLANLNTALAGLAYGPKLAYVGSDSLQISVTDSIDRLNGSGSVALTVNALAPPSFTAPSTASLNENTSLTFSGSISLTDAGASGTSDSLTLSVTNGKLTLGSTAGLTFGSGSNGSSSMTVSGTLANLNAALNGLIYAPNSAYSGADSLQLSVHNADDNDTATASVAITVNVPPPPSVTAPAAASLNENSSYTFAGTISLTDAAASGSSDSLSLSVTSGTLTLGSTAGLTFSAGSNGTSSITVTGTLANLNAAINGLVYAPKAGYSGSDLLQISLKDAADNLTGSGSVAITVNYLASPAVTAPSTASLKENSSYTFSGGAISLSDAFASGTSDALTITVANGKLSLGSTSGLTFSSGSNNSSSMTVTGTLANLNAAVSGLVYAPNSGFSGHDTLAFSLADSVDKLTGSAAVAIAVAPYVTAPATANVFENGSYSFSSSGGDPISATDGGAVGTSDSLTLTVLHGKVTLGSLTGLTIASGANGSSSITVTGTLANLNAALNGLVYTPSTGYTGSDTLTVTVNNASDGLSGSASVAITVAMKKIVSATAMVAVAPVDTTTADESDQWAGVSAAVDVLYA